MLTTLYSEWDPFCCAWLSNLMDAGCITPGVIVDKSICDLRPSDLEGYTRCHFFAGIGGWDYALRLAGWSADRPVWTGSCPCQPFSVAGKKKGTADSRHLWPDFFRLISACHPPVVFGEQVASKDGRDWLSGVRVGLEGLEYAVGGADLCAAGAGAPHIRQRLYWVADPQHPKWGSEREVFSETHRGNGFGRSGDTSGVGHSNHPRPQGRGLDAGEYSDQWVAGEASEFGGVADPPREQVIPSNSGGLYSEFSGSSSIGFWSPYDLLPCLDGKSRRVESGTFPLAHGIPARVGRLRGYGNAIVPQVAAEFIKAYMEVSRC